MTDPSQHQAQHTAAEGAGGSIDHGDGQATGAMPGMPTMSDMDTQGPDAMAAHGQATPNAFFFAAIILGLWLITSPFALAYDSTALTWSDVISGTLLIGFAVVTLMHGSVWAPWASSLVGALKTSGANSSHTPTSELAQGAHAHPRMSVTTANPIRMSPLITSLQVSVVLS